MISWLWFILGSLYEDNSELNFSSELIERNFDFNGYILAKEVRIDGLYLGNPLSLIKVYPAGDLVCKLISQVSISLATEQFRLKKGKLNRLLVWELKCHHERRD